jgi:hypothetical protein
MIPWSTAQQHHRARRHPRNGAARRRGASDGSPRSAAPPDAATARCELRSRRGSLPPAHLGRRRRCGRGTAYHEVAVKAFARSPHQARTGCRVGDHTSMGASGCYGSRTRRCCCHRTAPRTTRSSAGCTPPCHDDQGSNHRPFPLRPPFRPQPPSTQPSLPSTRPLPPTREPPTAPSFRHGAADEAHSLGGGAVRELGRWRVV